MRNQQQDIPKVAELLKNGGRCPVCGYVYHKGSERLGPFGWYYCGNNGVAHRAFHRQHVPVREPLIANFPPGDIRVDRQSPPWLHRLVYERARYLQRQEGYDFTQWDEERGLADNEYEKDIHALLLVEKPQLIVGAASFSWVLWTNHPPGWRLNFIWIAGTWRRQGVLSKRWPCWVKIYGAFTVEPPWSESMRAFLRKTGAPDPLQAKWLADTKSRRAGCG
jgi:hypothetical protein